VDRHLVQRAPSILNTGMLVDRQCCFMFVGNQRPRLQKSTSTIDTLFADSDEGDQDSELIVIRVPGLM
jgi:hypothetical protein